LSLDLREKYESPQVMSEEDEIIEAPEEPPEPQAESERKPDRRQPRRQPKAAAAASFVEYSSPDDKPWRCDMPDKLFADFGITGDLETRREALTRLHGDVAPVKESWDVIRRVYRLAPVIGASKDDLREWTIEDLAKEANVPVKRIETIIEETRVYWARKNNERELVAAR